MLPFRAMRPAVFVVFAVLSATPAAAQAPPSGPADRWVPRGTVVLLARADSNRGPLAGVVTTEVNVDEIDDLELRLDTPGTVEGRIVYDASVPAASRATRITLTQQLLPVSPLYPAPESAVSADGRLWIENALGVFDVDVPRLRVVRVTRLGRELPGVESVSGQARRSPVSR